MKEIFLFSFFAMAIGFSNESVAQVTSKHRVDIYSAVESSVKLDVSSIETNGVTTTYDKSYTRPPMGFRYEYRVSPRFGIGFDMIYSNITQGGTMTGAQIGEKSFKYVVNRYRFQSRFTYHFNSRFSRFDFYAGGAAGCNSKVRRYYVDNVRQPEAESGFLIVPPLPVSLRIYSGVVFQIHKNIGVNAEVGLGGAIISMGATVCF